MSTAPSSEAFALLLGEALHRYGTPSHRLEATLQRVCERMGLEARFLSTPTALHVSFGALGELRSGFVRVEPGELDLEKLIRLDGVADDVMHGRATLPEALAAVQAILSAGPRYGAWLTVLSHGLAGAGAARLLGGGWPEMVVAGTSSLVIGLFAVLSSNVQSLSRVLDAVAAVAASFLAVLAAVHWRPLSVSVATLAGLVVLLPGLTMTVAMNELATRHLISGTARLMGAVLVFLKLGFGVALGGRVAAALFGAAPAAPLRIVSGSAWTEPLSLGLLSLALAVLLRARPRDVGWIAFTGTVGYVCARGGAAGFGFELGAFFGALVLGVASNLVARWRNLPSVVTVVPGLVLLVPGSVGFRSLESLIQRDVLGGVGTGFSMVLAAIALVSGLLFANALVPSRRVL